jgi:hypothetical protein
VGSVGFQPLQLETLRARFRKLSEPYLRQFGRAAASLCLPEDQFGHALRRVFVKQLHEARVEWLPASQGAHLGRQPVTIGPGFLTCPVI